MKMPRSEPTPLIRTDARCYANRYGGRVIRGGSR